MGTGRQYDEEFKKQAIKLGKEVGIKELEKVNRKFKELNEFLEEASAFFAASRRKSGKKNG